MDLDDVHEETEMKRVPVACMECKKKHGKCDMEKPCGRCKQLGIECIEPEIVKKTKKETSPIMVVNPTERRKRKITEDNTPCDENLDVLSCRYNFKLDIGIDTPFYQTGKLISTNMPHIQSCSPSLLVMCYFQTHLLEEVGVYRRRNFDIIDKDSFSTCIDDVDVEIKQRHQMLKWGSKEKLECEVHAHGRVLIRDKEGNLFEMVKECVRVYKKEDPSTLEAIVFHLFWTD